MMPNAYENTTSLMTQIEKYFLNEVNELNELADTKERVAALTMVAEGHTTIKIIFVSKGNLSSKPKSLNHL